MEELLSYQSNLLANTNKDWYRYLYPRIASNERLLGLKGLRGVGKTTLLLQYLANGHQDLETGMYVTADHPYFYQHSLFDLASQWYSHKGRLLLVDEIHKYPNWSRELKLIYDGHPDLQLIFTSSSALDLYRGESDLSRRLMTLELHGMSFREYLSLVEGLNFPSFSLEEVLNNATSITRELTTSFQPLSYFKSYLKEGYFPFIKEINRDTLQFRLLRIVNTVLESDLTYIEDYSASNIMKIKKLLGVIAASAPFEPNISKIAHKLQIGRNTVVSYLGRLYEARILTLISKPGRGITALQKPDKIYFENSAFAYAFQNQPNIGTIRETFFGNQIKNAGHKLSLSSQADFVVDGKYEFEVGGKSKDSRQIKGLDNSFLALDDMEIGIGHKIPLWLFGFLY